MFLHIYYIVCATKVFVLLLYLSKVTNFKQITTRQSRYQFLFWLLFYLSKVTNYKQIITF